jgi:hypothetical protein
LTNDPKKYARIGNFHHDFTEENAMRNLLIIISTCSAIGFVASAAYGEVIRPIKGNHSIGEIARTCQKSGGALWSDSSGYGCLKGNCDGKGGECNVECNQSGKCNGKTPTITTGKQTGSHASLSTVLVATGNKSTGNNSSGKQLGAVQTTGVDKTRKGGPTHGTKGPSHNTEPVVRDHRTTPIVRDHRTPSCQGKSCK